MLLKQKSRRFSLPINKKHYRSVDNVYNKYAAFLYGYILSVVKDKEQSENILVKIFIELNGKPLNLEEEYNLLKYIQIANKLILEITTIDLHSLLPIIIKKKALEKVEN
ncbi:MAG: hypothetical protein ABI359_05425 [Ginsengibacter sp.]